ncbi:MAG: DUF3047 domain-containing protein [Gammaproteobacteria bacterium]|nr:DUF3047 domain-containing protein [Gammaproteobacteria bacterium]
MQYLFLILLTLPSASLSDTLIPIGDFSNKSLSGWTEKEFDGITQYGFVSSNDKFVLKADSNKSASGLFKEIRIDLNKTPYLNWSWQISNTLTSINEETKEGDDYPARIYIVQKHDFLFWKTKALNYVWSSNQKIHSNWDNAYTSQAKMYAVRGKESKLNQWYHEKRNVKEDLKKLFGEDITYIDAVAIMTDTDNSELKVNAFYGDIFFSSN